MMYGMEQEYVKKTTLLELAPSSPPSYYIIYVNPLLPSYMIIRLECGGGGSLLTLVPRVDPLQLPSPAKKGGGTARVSYLVAKLSLELTTTVSTN
jgi:hypothetical protein